MSINSINNCEINNKNEPSLEEISQTNVEENNFFFSTVPWKKIACVAIGAFVAYKAYRIGSFINDRLNNPIIPDVNKETNQHVKSMLSCFAQKDSLSERGACVKKYFRYYSKFWHPDHCVNTGTDEKICNANFEQLCKSKEAFLVLNESDFASKMLKYLSLLN